MFATVKCVGEHCERKINHSSELPTSDVLALAGFGLSHGFWRGIGTIFGFGLTKSQARPSANCWLGFGLGGTSPAFNSTRKSPLVHSADPPERLLWNRDEVVERALGERGRYTSPFTTTWRRWVKGIPITPVIATFVAKERPEAEAAEHSVWDSDFAADAMASSPKPGETDKAI
ncbi:hypothetical protein C8R44DRAFT_724956 [Mycena epipterygia]|nr:hypothetical protein C8R44DRAFT_724956 [Mycena epipterygia]